MRIMSIMLALLFFAAPVFSEDSGGNPYFHKLSKLSRYDKEMIDDGEMNLVDVLMRDFNRNTFAEDNGELILFDFYTTWCHTCTKFKETFTEILPNHPGEQYFVEMDATKRKYDGWFLKEVLVKKAYPNENTKYFPYFLIYKWNSSLNEFEQVSRGFEDPLLYLWEAGYRSRDFEKWLKFIKVLPKD